MVVHSNHQLALAAAAVAATVLAAVKKAKSKSTTKKKKQPRTVEEASTTSTGICSSTTKASNIQTRSSSTIARRASSMLSNCISAVSSKLVSEKEMKRITVLDAIQHICAASNDNQQNNVLQDIHKALLEEGNNKLEAVVLSSGSGSYSFIVFVENRPDLCLYAELTFGDNVKQRAENEWANMRSLYSTPLGCWDVAEETGGTDSAMLLIAQWSNKKINIHQRERNIET